MIKGRYQIESTSPGEMLRDEARRGTAIGIEASARTSQGLMVPDAVVIGMVKNWLAEHNGAFVFDGFPRTLEQADALEALLEGRNTPLDIVFFLNVPLEAIRDRVVRRVTCEKCGAVFSLGLHVGSVVERCPVCQGTLGKRSDDTLEALEHRMAEYREKTEPVERYYRKRGFLRELDGSQKPEVVFGEISTVIAGL
jgi:adenylate kinase